MNNDAVNLPKHYDGDACMVAIEELLGPDKAAGFCLGNAIKYMWRAGRKDPAKEKEDEQKALWYMRRVVKIMQERE
jgi:Protein of unknwon function (DUF3310)